MAAPKITVITPSFNQGETLEETIRSVLDQGYSNLEYMILDGGSTDDSVDIIKRYADRLSYWVSEKDRGQSHAINKGLERATGDVVAWLNSDDFYYPGALETIAQAYTAHPEAGLYVGNGALVDKSGARIRRYSNGIAFDFETLLRGSNFILQPSTFINRKALDKAGLVDESLHYVMDLELWLRIGRDWPVVTIGQELSAYRWSDDIKTASGGLKRWVEQWEMVRRYSDAQLTPGLLVEFFKVLQEEGVRRDLGMDGVEQVAETAWHSFYAAMQDQLGTADCIPRQGTEIRFVPCLPGASTSAAAPQTPPAAKPRAPALIQTPGSAPRVDIVLQATGIGQHAWGVGRGWENAARKLGMFHRTFAPTAQWGALDVDFDDGLFSYLANPEADIILLLGFDWHSQMLHNNPRWRERWASAPLHKVLYAQESIVRSCRQLGNTLPRQAALSAADLADLVVYTDVTDEAFVQVLGKPSLWQPFGVDDSVFAPSKAFAERKARAFFRGKVAAFTDKTYVERRELIQFLQQHGAIDLLEYRDRPVAVEDLVADFNDYRIALNFPSVFSNHPTRVYEALASGCALVTNATGIAPIDDLFENGRHLQYYRNREELLEAVQSLSRDAGRAQRLAAAGREHVLAHFTLDRHLRQIVDTVAAEGSRPQGRPARVAAGAVGGGARRRKARVVIDGVIFFLQQGRAGGISRVWISLLQELARSNLAQDIVLLDRGGTAPTIPGIRTRVIDDYDYRYFEDDSLRLQQICEAEGAELFLSTYYSYPEQCHSMLLLHDMVPELRGEDLQHPEWRAKEEAIQRADAYLSVSESTARDFRKLYPQLGERGMFITPNAADEAFRPRPAAEVEAFRRRHGIDKPYFLLVGQRLKYKNAMLFFRALALLADRADIEVVCTGGVELEPVFQPYVEHTRVHMLGLDDDELAAAYSGALALVYPSQYEGFGLPVLEAMGCGCPVITCRNSSLPEVAGDAALFVDEADVGAMVAALNDVRRPDVRAALIERGAANVPRFNWRATGEILVGALRDTLAEVKTRPLHPRDPLRTGGRLILGLGEAVGRTPVVDAMVRLKAMYTGWVLYDHHAIRAAEDVIAAMDDDHFAVLRKAMEDSRHCDTFLHYWFGLALEHRGAVAEALQAFATASRRHDWVAGYRWRVAERAADAAMAVGQPALARGLLDELVLKEFPAHPSARAKLARAEEAVRNPSAMPQVAPAPQAPVAPAAEPTAGQAAPLVSVIVSVYKAAQYLPGCLDDLLAQTIADRIEIIVVDSGSPESEGDIVRQYQARAGNIRYLRTDRRESVYAAWNRGIEMACGRYVTNANADDRHAPDALEKLAAVLDAQPDTGVVYADCAVTQEANATLRDGHAVGRFRWPDFDRTRLFQVCFVGPQPMWRRSLHEQHGLFDANLESAGDYEFWLRVSDKTRFAHVPEVLGLYLQSVGSIEHRDAGLALRESEAARERHWNPADGPRPAPAGNFLELYVPDAYAQQPRRWPLVSVVIPTHNRPRELGDALRSVLNQSYPNLEIVVVNDGGEEVRGVIDGLNATRPIEYVSHEASRGTGGARNTGMSRARGEYIAFLDDDDVYLPQHLGAVVAELEADPHLAAAYSDGLQVTIDLSGETARVADERVFYSQDFSADELLVRNYIPNLCVVARRRAMEQAGPFDEAMPALEDWEWLLRLCRVGAFRHLPLVTVEYLVRQGGPSRNRIDRGEIAELYQRIYTQAAPWSTPEVRARQELFFREMTGGALQAAAPAQDSRREPTLSEPCAEEADVPRVVAMTGGSAGSREHRVCLPLAALERARRVRARVLPKDGVEVHVPTVADLARDGADVLLAHNAVHDQQIQALEDIRKHGDVVMVYGQDDLMFDLPIYNSFRTSVYPDIKKRLRRGIGLCDRLVVTSEAMAEAYRGMSDDIRIVPNQLERSIWEPLRSLRRQGGKPRVGWAGAQQHNGDLEIIFDVVKETSDEIQWVFFGLCFEEWLPYGVEVQDPVEFELYPRTLAGLNLDLAVAPLAHNRFNRCKSDLKLIEYGALGIPVVCTDIDPYRDAPVTRVRNTRHAWLQAIRERIHDLDAAARDGDELRRWVFEQRMLDQHLDQWLDALSPASGLDLARAAGEEQ